MVDDCSTHGWEEKCTQCVGGETQNKETTQETQDYKGDSIKIDIKETRLERVHHINLTQKRKKVASCCEDGHKWPGFRKAQIFLTR